MSEFIRNAFSGNIGATLSPDNIQTFKHSERVLSVGSARYPTGFEGFDPSAEREEVDCSKWNNTLHECGSGTGTAQQNAKNGTQQDC